MSFDYSEGQLCFGAGSTAKERRFFWRADRLRDEDYRKEETKLFWAEELLRDEDYIE